MAPCAAPDRSSREAVHRQGRHVAIASRMALTAEWEKLILASDPQIAPASPRDNHHGLAAEPPDNTASPGDVVSSELVAALREGTPLRHYLQAGSAPSLTTGAM